MKASPSSFMVPTPRPEIADVGLTRPDWTVGDGRKKPLTWLDRNENADPILEALVSRLVQELPPETFRLYPDYAPVYEKLAGHLGVTASNLAFGGGSDGVIRMVFESYVDRGDTVILTEPTFGMYPVYCRLAGAMAVAVSYRPSAGGPVLDIDELIAAIVEHRPKLVCIPNPDSPTGTIVAESDLRRIVEAAGAVGALMLLDEAYYPFYPFTAMPWVDSYPNLVIARTASKAWGIAGFRVGFAIAHATVTPYLHKVRPNYAITTPALAVFNRLIDHYDEVLASVARLNCGKSAFSEAMTRIGLHVLRTEGNFIHVAFGRYSAAVHAALSDLVLYRHDFSHPALKGFSRMSITTAERFQPIIDRIASVVVP